MPAVQSAVPTLVMKHTSPLMNAFCVPQHPNFTQNSNFMHDGTTLIYFASEYVAPDQPTNSCAVPIGDVVYYSSQ